MAASDASSLPAMVLRDIRATYPARRGQGATAALRGVSMSVPQGQMVALLGPNGSGKSTLFRILCCLMPVDGGEIEVFGQREPAMIRRAISVVFQSPGLDRHLTVWENLRDQAALYGIGPREARRRIDEELEAFNLADRRDAIVKTLSGGLARRVDLVRALLHRPRVLLLDEPTVGLDPSAREDFLRTIEQRRTSDGLTILMSTHLVDEADRCDRVVLLHEGAVVADDAPTALRQRIGGRRVVVHRMEGPPVLGDRGAWKRVASGWSMTMADEPLDGRLARPSRSSELAAALAASGESFSMSPPTLADLFEEMTGQSLDDRDRDAETPHG